MDVHSKDTKNHNILYIRKCKMKGRVRKYLFFKNFVFYKRNEYKVLDE